MLYVSTRSQVDSYTAYRVLHEDRAPDGGFFVPYRLPKFSASDMTEMSKKTFGGRIAHILNIFFPVGLSGWDVDFAVGRRPYKLVTMSHKLYIAELWHNLQTDFHYFEKGLYEKLCDRENQSSQLSTWARIAIRIAVIVSLGCEFRSMGIYNFDIAGAVGDYSFLIATWYAAEMGLPIGRFICTSDENGGAWELFHNGEFQPNKANRDTLLPLLDCSASMLEMLIYEMFGREKAASFVSTYQNSTTFTLGEEELNTLSNSVVGAVVSRARYKELIRNVYRTHGYIAEPYVAVAYGGLQDYRSRSGESRTTLILSEICPKVYESIIYDAIGSTK